MRYTYRIAYKDNGNIIHRVVDSVLPASKFLKDFAISHLNVASIDDDNFYVLDILDEINAKTDIVLFFASSDYSEETNTIIYWDTLFLDEN